MYEFLRLNVKAFCTCEKGISSLEYAILAIVILGVIYAALNGDSFTTAFSNMASTVSSVAQPKPAP